ncbi:MAG: ParB N-terminal domain-containing protein [Bauldia sp.]|nr:ParB N-terminal domain-containing protein [Bauldia sp.]MCW5716734.1 ParB N-terminal domain-containing protein [Bauldia sp.]
MTTEEHDVANGLSTVEAPVSNNLPLSESATETVGHGPGSASEEAKTEDAPAKGEVTEHLHEATSDMFAEGAPQAASAAARTDEPQIGVAAPPAVAAAQPALERPANAEALQISRVHRTVTVALVRARADARAIVPETVSALKESIRNVGLLNPIHVRQVDGGYEVIAGAHRLAAFRELGLAEIPCFVRTNLDELHAELSMIDENLCRAELGEAELSAAIARRKAIYEQLHPQTKHGGNLVGDGVAKMATPDTLRFTADTAKASGMSERVVQRRAERGEKVVPEVRAIITGTPADTGAFLDDIKDLPQEEQVVAAKREVARLASKKATPRDAANKDEQHVGRLLSTWGVASEKARADFLNNIGATRHV